MNAVDADFMRRAIAVARPRLGLTRPNPVVGCVLVADGRCIAEAATGEGGRPHAEEQALVLGGAAAKGATAYVTLEPCACRSSGQPGCADRLIAAGVARVVVACEDDSALAAGAGLRRLRAAGITVELGLLADEAKILASGFLHRERTGRPLVEESANGLGYESRFVWTNDEPPAAALARLGGEGYTRLWVPRGSVEANILKALGFIGG